jgi:BirA family transcriptional regulator, biotin operon repressor / biotin---[acetyl-CoA-carboxylase] ligase
VEFRIRRVDQTGSTNADVLAAAAAGEDEGLVVVARTQTAGRGRQGRAWVSPPGGGLWFTVLMRPGQKVPAARFGWLPLLGGLALAEAVREVAKVDAGLKWPNDLLIGEAKCAGILAEATGTGIVALGIGLNTGLDEHQLPPTPTGLRATSLRLAGASRVDNDELLDAILDRLSAWYAEWRIHNGDAEASGLRRAYQERCLTIGKPVRAILPGGAEISGRATTVDIEGRLMVGGQVVAAGDVVHLRLIARVDPAD